MSLKKLTSEELVGVGLRYPHYSYVLEINVILCCLPYVNRLIIGYSLGDI